MRKYDRYKVDSIFLHHYIRRNLLITWNKYSKRTDERRPGWIPPFEVLDMHVEREKEGAITCRDLTIEVEGVKKLKEVENLPLRLVSI